VAHDSGIACTHRERSCGAWSWPDLGGERVRSIAPGIRGVLVATTRGLWRYETSGRRRLLDDPMVVHAAEDARRTVVLLAGGGIADISDGTPRTLMPADGYGPARPRSVSIALRGDEVWAALDRYLVVARPDEPPTVFGSAEGIESGGPLLIDREQGLWMGMFSGLLQLPEPATRAWDDRHGLPSRHTRYLTGTAHRVYVTTWQGGGMMERGRGGWTARSLGVVAQSRPCPDASGRVWMGGGDGIVVYDDGRPVKGGANAHPTIVPGPLTITGCAVAADSSLWMSTYSGLLRAGPVTPAVAPVPLPPAVGDDLHSITWDANGRLWLAAGPVVCTGRTASGAGMAIVPGLACDTLPGVEQVNALLEVTPGRIWAATTGQGVMERGRSGWAQAAGAESLPTGTIFSLLPSRRGGVWIVGHGVIQRVIPRAGGWRVEERLGFWHGVPAGGASDLMEAEDGTVWLTTELGVVRVAPSARAAAMAPPPVAVAGLWVGSRRAPVDSVPAVRFGRGDVAIRFAALSFRDPHRVRYQVRLSSREPWRDVVGEPTFRWARLEPGRHVAQVRASLDGARWSPEPARAAFTVLPPWYRHPAAIAAMAAAALLALLVAYRIRVSYLLGVERERTRIAMDLHDAIGSGLGSIGLLSGVLANPSLAAGERTRVTGEIAATAGELGDALSDIVWSLGRRATTLAELATRLVEHGARLEAAGAVRFTARLPDPLPALRLPLAIRRNVLFIGLEALHNAARHSGAASVQLELSPAGDRWILFIEDDGRGGAVASEAAGPDGGHGLRAMQARARDIGATITVDSDPERGTRVRLEFGTSRRAHMIMRLGAAAGRGRLASSPPRRDTE
jgi:signal transduction histidine kinase